MCQWNLFDMVELLITTTSWSAKYLQTQPKIFEETMSAEDKYKYQAASSTSGNQRFQIKKVKIQFPELLYSYFLVVHQAEVAYMLLWLFMLVAWSSILIGEKNIITKCNLAIVSHCLTVLMSFIKLECERRLSFECLRMWDTLILNKVRQ